MVIEIGGKEVELNFGYGFLMFVNEHYGQKDQNGVRHDFGGMITLYQGIATQDPITLYKIIRAGTSRPNKKVHLSESAIFGFIDELFEKEKYEEFYTELWEEIKKKPHLRKGMAEGLTEEYVNNVQNLHQ